MLDEHLRTDENGFMVGRSVVVTSKLYGRLTEGAKANNLPAVLTFIDVSKAFDFVSGTTMVKILYAAYVGMLTDREREINLF